MAKPFPKLVEERLGGHDTSLKNIPDFIDFEVSQRARKRKPVIVFITDDGALEDYTFAKPIFQAENVPCCVCLITSKIDVDPTFMTKAQALELQGMGWEVLSHSVTHTYPYITSMSDADAEAEYRDSKAWLLANGFNVQSYSTPGGLYNTRERLFSKKYYRAARVSDPGVDGLNVPPLETHELKTIWIDSTNITAKTPNNDPVNTLPYYQYYIDNAVVNNAMLIISFHSLDAKNANYGSLFTQVIQYAKSKAPIMTLRDALNIMGNVVDIGDFTKTSTGTRAISGDHFIIDCEGNINDSTIPMINQYDCSTPFSSFPIGTTYSRITISKGSTTGSPENYAGTLITHKFDNNSGNSAYNWQEYHVYNSNNIYKRYIDTSGSYTAWTKSSDLYPIDKFDCSTAFSSFPIGITYNSVSITKASTTGSPESKGGVLVTYNVDQTNLGMNYQEYNIYLTNKKYKRVVNADGTWSAWTKISTDNVIFLQDKSLTHGSIPAYAFVDVTYSYAYVKASDYIGCCPQYGIAGGLVYNAFCGTDGVITVRVYNSTNTAVTCNRIWNISIQQHS